MGAALSAARSAIRLVCMRSLCAAVTARRPRELHVAFCIQDWQDGGERMQIEANGSQGADEAMTSASERASPVVALAMGDPAGISPELTARLVADRSITEVARLVVIADRRVLDQGARVAGIALEF